jgi:hypothetical protein
MNPEYSFTDEILSAFLDGELPEDERKKVEDWLESSSAARQELEDLRQIGALVRSIPMPSVPAGFQAALMQRVEQEAGEVYRRPPQADAAGPNGQMQSASTGAPAPRPTATGESIKRWLGGFVSFAAAMGILLAVGFILQNRNANDGNLAQEDAERTNAISDAQEVSAFGGAGLPETPREPDPENEASLPAPWEDAAPPPSPRGMPEPSAAPTAAAPADIDRTTLPPGGTALEEIIARRGNSSLPLTPGEVAEIADEAVVVEIVCVDVAAVENATNRLQVLLTANGIRSASDYGYGVPVDPASVGVEEGDQVMIYVEADAATMAQALAQMDEFNDVSNVGVNYLAQNTVLDGNVGEAVYPLLNQVGEGFDLVAQATPGIADATAAPSESPNEEEGEAVDPAPAPANIVSPADEPGGNSPIAGDVMPENGVYVTQPVDGAYTTRILEQQEISNRDQNSQARSSAYQIAQNTLVPPAVESQGVEIQQDDQGDAEREGAVDGQPPSAEGALLPPLQVIFLVRTP